MFRPFIALVIYFVVQLVCSIPVIVFSLFNGRDSGNIMPYAEVLSWTLIISSVITVVLLHVFKFINVARPGVSELKPKSTLLAIASVVLLMFASSVLTEWVSLDNIMAEQFMAMALTVPGALAISVIGPIAEEYLFREAIQGGMLRYGARPWVACVVSAFIFGLVHGNPAQILFAFLIGLVFAVVYMHTRSIVPVIICHIINNSTSVVLMNIYSDNPNIGFNEILGTTPAVVAFVLSLAVGLLLLRLFLKQSRAEQTA